LRWSIRGVFGYTIDGPTSGNQGSASGAFTVQLVSGVEVDGTVVITPHASAGGTFTPSTLSLTNESPSATFTFTPSGSGVYSIGATNNKGLIDSQELNYTSYATLYTLSGPSSGDIHVASTNFTVALPTSGVIVGSITVTPNDGGDGGTFTPTSVVLTSAAPSKTFTYTPNSVGSKTISTTNSGTLTNPTPLSYNSIGLANNDPVSTWFDSSVNGKNAAMTGSNRPIFKTAIVNSKPVVRFSVAGASKLDLSGTIPGTWPWTAFAVMKPASPGDTISALTGSDGGLPLTAIITGGNMDVSDRDGFQFIADPDQTAFHVITGKAAASGNLTLRYDGTLEGTAPFASPNTGDFAHIAYSASGPGYGDGDIAEIIIYSAALSSTDMANIEKYLGTKYGITVAGGSAVQPDTVTGLAGWWKADSLG
jgi:hypothetical protein